jgi:hypothetical protein
MTHRGLIIDASGEEDDMIGRAIQARTDRCFSEWVFRMTSQGLGGVCYVSELPCTPRSGTLHWTFGRTCRALVVAAYQLTPHLALLAPLVFD